MKSLVLFLFFSTFLFANSQENANLYGAITLIPPLIANIPVSLGFSVWLVLPLNLVLIVILLRIIGKKV